MVVTSGSAEGGGGRGGELGWCVYEVESGEGEGEEEGLDRREERGGGEMT